MSHRAPRVVRSPSRAIGVACLVILLCVCVVTQILGMPVTLIGLLASDAPAESLSEDLSALSSAVDIKMPVLLGLFSDIRPRLHLPVLLTSVFHPPAPVVL